MLDTSTATNNLINCPPEIEIHDGITVIRDTYPGGTKGRYLWQLFATTEEVVYASSAEGTAQIALAAAAQRWGKQATIFGAERKVPHPRQLEVQKLGGRFIGVRPGYLNVIQSRACEYACDNGAYLLPFGAKTPYAIEIIADCASSLKLQPDYIWCASGSGTLITALCKAWPMAKAHVTQVGHKLTAAEVAGATIHVSPFKYSQEAPVSSCPFDADGTYERKAWLMLQQWREANKPKGQIVFWSVTGAPQA